MQKGFKWERWGVLDYAGGLLDQPMGLMDRVGAHVSVYEAWKAFSTAGNKIVDWKEANPGQFKIIIMVQKWRAEAQAGDL